MTADGFELFYAYATEDEGWHKKLDKHLSPFVRQGLITPWHAQEVTAGKPWDIETRKHLETARIILLLVSADFLASDYCYDVQVQIALRRHEMDKTRVIPILLKPCHWDDAPFGKLQVLPGNRKPVTMWTNKDAAFANIANGIRKVVDELNAPQATGDKQMIEGTKSTRGGDLGRNDMVCTPTSIGSSVLKSAIKRYNDELKCYQEVADYELGLRAAFQNLLANVAKSVGWSLAPELTIGKIRPDGVLLDVFRIRRGYWEAKGPDANLEKEITRKIQDNYPLTNTIFENTKKAILYQGKKRFPVEFNLRNANDISDLLQQFFTYVEPDIENFEEAVDEFKGRIPDLAQGLLNIIKDEHKLNRRFIATFNSFAELCRSSLDAKMSDETIDEMLVQHLLTERLFRTVFNNPDFVNNNAIAAEIEKVIRALASRSFSFNRNEFLKSLDRFYVAIERAAKGIENWSERQEFLNTVYERFFQGFSIKTADTHGIVYTPQEIVDFMVTSVDEVLKREFGKSIDLPGIKILDPATGTGNFVVNIIRHITSRTALQEKYAKDLFCNEIMLLPYYIASLNIEHEYYEQMKQYEPFAGVCFTDTLELAEEQQLSLFVEENTERVKREKEADIMVVIGNPPYNVGQMNENDNNKNRRYPKIDNRIKETYVKDSKATNRNALSDVYVKFFRWATDRLQGRDGIVCLVTNNSFIDQIAFDGMRKYLQKDFTQIYHLDLHGNVRKNPKISGTTHNVFGIQVGVGITLAVRSSQNVDRKIYYYRVPENWRKTNKLLFLTEKRSIASIDWLELLPDSNYNWLTDRLHPSFKSYIPIGSKDARAANSLGSGGTEIEAIFKAYSPGAQTSRDDWVYDFEREALEQKVTRFIETYNNEVDRWKRTPEPKNVDSFVLYDDTKIKWSRDLKADLKRGRYAEFSVKKLRQALYRPFTVKSYFFDPILSQDIFLLPRYFPTLASEVENCSIVLTNLGAEKPFMVIAANRVPDYHLVGAGAVSLCFPFYIYAEDGSNRRENITDWALKQFQDQYGQQITKWDIFHYIYALLHHPQYRDLYKENLKRDLPHIPLLQREEAFEACVSVGRQLLDMHVNYEQVEEYTLKEIDNGELSYEQSRRVDKKMKLSEDKTSVIVNKALALEGIPLECFEYRLGNRSALEWVIDQYQVSIDKRSGIESDPNRLEDPEYIIRLVKQIVTVSIKTVELVKELADAITVSDWLNDTMVTPIN